MITRGLTGMVAALVVSIAAPAQISSNFFGVSVSNNAGVVWPNSIAQPMPVSAIRLWDSGTRWDQLEVAPGVYNWGPLDIMLAQAQANNQTVLYTFGGVPPFASSNPNDTSCSEGIGSCDPPNGLNYDGSGTNVQFKAFVTALMAHTGTQIQSFEAWNEANNTPFWNGTAAQMVRMAHDAREIIKAYNPSAIVLTPSTCACNNLSFTNWTYDTSNPEDGMLYYLETKAEGVRGSPTGAALADGVAVHTYVGANPPENILGFITKTQTAMAEAGVASLPLYITEDSWGPNTNVPGCSSEPPFTQACLDTAAAFAARSLALAASNGVVAYYWYAWGNNSHGTLYNTSSGQLYESGIAYAQTRTWLTGATPVAPCSYSHTVYTCAFTRPGRFVALMVWDTAQNCNAGCTTSTYRVPVGYTTRYDLAGDPPATLGSTTQIGIKPILLANRDGL